MPVSIVCTYVEAVDTNKRVFTFLNFFALAPLRRLSPRGSYVRTLFLLSLLLLLLLLLPPLR